MKNIELNKKQKEMLLEMCKVLFPEPKFSFWWEYEMYGRGLKQEFNDVLCVSETLNPPINVGTEEKPYFRTNNYFNIHWFEFCMTHLIVKLSKEFTKQKLSKADYTNNQYPNWFSEKVSYHLNPFRNEEFEEDILFIHPIDYLYEEFKKLK